MPALCNGNGCFETWAISLTHFASVFRMRHHEQETVGHMHACMHACVRLHSWSFLCILIFPCTVFPSQEIYVGLIKKIPVYSNLYNHTLPRARNIAHTRCMHALKAKSLLAALTNDGAEWLMNNTYSLLATETFSPHQPL